MRLENQVAVVTGAGRGIGRAIARSLATEGASVALVARTKEQLDVTADEIRADGGLCHVISADVTDRESTERAVAETVATFGAIDVLVNNAGSFVAIGPVWEVDPDDWWRDVTTNVRGTFLMSRAVLPQMIERRKGKIINLSGGGAVAPFPFGSGYGSSKAAVVRFSDILHAEAKAFGIKVYAMGPGLVRTAMTEYQATSREGQKYLGRIADMFAEGRDVPPTEAGRLAAFLASSDGDALAGRVIGVADDYEGLASHADMIAKNDLYTLRLRT